MKTLRFTILLIGWDIRNQQISRWTIIKHHACNPNMLFDASNVRKYQTVIQNCLQMGHPKSIKNHQKSCMQSKPVVWCFKWQKISKNDPKWSPKGTQNPSKIIKNSSWDLPGSLCVHLWPAWLQNDAKMVSKDLQMDPKWSSGDPKRS